MRFILNNVRTPAEREGDFAAQIMANLTGVRRLRELMSTHGADRAVHYAEALNDYAETVTRTSIEELPDGEYEFTDWLDGDAQDAVDVPIHVRLAIRGSEAGIDFSGSGDQVAGSVNAVRAITVSAVLYIFRCLTSQSIPANAGCLRPLTIVTRPGSIVDAQFPAAVAGGNVETAQRIVDAVLGALARAVPERIPAASQGTMNNVAIGGHDPRRDEPFAYYETLAGGMGASRTGDGESAVHSHMTNTLNTPVEALEYAYPFLVREYSIRRGTGGAGKHCGGDGLVREIELLGPAEATVLSERRTRGPWGLAGGEAGEPGRNVVVRRGREEAMPGKFTARLEPGDVLRLETPGGGGWGRSEG
jgi:N-methylhydantoinase B